MGIKDSLLVKNTEKTVLECISYSKKYFLNQMQNTSIRLKAYITPNIRIFARLT
jgi:hypothetical protein